MGWRGGGGGGGRGEGRGGGRGGGYMRVPCVVPDVDIGLHAGLAHIYFRSFYI